jgi:trehalose synthase
VLQPVAVGSKTLADYTHIFGRDKIEEIRELAEPLRGARVAHISATAFGGGIAEILYTLVPLMRDVGLDVEWQVIYGREEFFNATKLLHNALQGAPDGLAPEHWATWEHYNEINARELPEGWDVCVVHDPQPAALHRLVPEKSRSWVWRCHIDLSTPNPAVMERLLPFISDYPQSLFHLAAYVPEGMHGKVNVVPPAIDPLAPKNMALAPEDASYVTNQFGIDVDRPLMVQVSRFDPWKDPLGVIDAYRMVKEELPQVQLALVGAMASDDPEGWDYYNATVAHAAGDPDIHILNNFNNVGSIEVNAFQSQADVVVQKSIREGFGLTVTEALWKGRPFVGGNVGGIPLQVEQGISGYLADTVETCAARCADILRDPALGKALGRRGKEHVRRNFLTPRYLRDYLRIFGQLLGVGAANTVARDGVGTDGDGVGRGPAGSAPAPTRAGGAA